MSTPDPFAELRAELQRMKERHQGLVICSVTDVEALLARFDGKPLPPEHGVRPRLVTDEDAAANVCVHYARDEVPEGQLYYIPHGGGWFACKRCAERVSGERAA